MHRHFKATDARKIFKLQFSKYLPCKLFCVSGFVSDQSLPKFVRQGHNVGGERFIFWLAIESIPVFRFSSWYFVQLKPLMRRLRETRVAEILIYHCKICALPENSASYDVVLYGSSKT